MNLWPFFCFYGGKWRMARRLPNPRHPTIVEPFAGSAGYSLRHPHLQVRLYDVDPTIVALWRYLIEVPEGEIRSLPTVIEDVRHLDVRPEARSLIGFWLNKGMTAPCNVPSKWMRDGWRPKSQWGPEIRERIASQLHAIRHWTVDELSWEKVPCAETATWFVDPPYNNRVGRRYRHHDIDYAALGAWCQALPGEVIVCEQDGADWLPFEPFAAIKSTRGTSSECVYLQGIHDH